ncbi:MAG: hypothetical protein N3I35_16075 [Clostridia bacterium]|nr:hypothetical protein [Clostridia bacterium]
MKNYFSTFIRIIGIVVEVFFIIISFGDLFVFFHADEIQQIPKFRERLISNIQYIVFGVLLLIPYREIRLRKLAYLHFTFMIFLAMVICKDLVYSINSYFEGGKSILISFAGIFILLSNLWVILCIQEEMKIKVELQYFE